ncbi:uncharacterized protein LOC381059 [Mus musculus]|uniref:Gene model 1604B, (NCBI) n=1 Tax=Mus musculus TaxID=10090 RepID=Q3TRG0_MOUSE|nr:uncharacterized protein LOC381059 [Mus musculus]AAI47041.1 Gene model 1604B, (NCBI) [Mus musculus]AAI47042.1 Gene model 1604B, (NCBI) [Mus musculus]BAE37070.1 unnamed protein product [Mus musculus]|eukprot:NP_001028614.1 uncharacterized protein LOC381059 [Mus musculus]
MPIAQLLELWKKIEVEPMETETAEEELALDVEPTPEDTTEEGKGDTTSSAETQPASSSSAEPCSSTCSQPDQESLLSWTPLPRSSLACSCAPPWGNMDCGPHLEPPCPVLPEPLYLHN